MKRTRRRIRRDAAIWLVRSFSVAALVVLLCGPVGAQRSRSSREPADPKVKVGEFAPDFELPDRKADHEVTYTTREDQALTYRLSGDRNPLHSDPSFAKMGGFDRPILHGRCTHGIACHAVLKTVCDYDFTLINGFDVRFSSPVFPGDIVTTEMWQDGNVVSFRCRVREREAIVINGGRCTLQA